MHPSLHLASSPHVLLADGAVVALPARDAVMLAWLALEGATPRARLAALLWPESEDEAARNALRQRLFQLRRQFGAELVAGSTTLSLAPGVAHDLADSDSVLGGVQHDFGPELSTWLQQQRERRRQRMRQSLAELSDMAERARDYADALSHAHELLALEPLSEDAHRRVIRLHYLAGDRAAALLAFDRCEQVLKHEVGAPPAPETLALLAHIESSGERSSGPQPHVLPASLARPAQQVGREREEAELLAAWAAGEPFLLLGESGMGKSRLLESVVQAWRGALPVGARPGDELVPLALVTRLVELLCSRYPALLHQEVVRELRSHVQAEVPGAAPVAGGGRPAPRSLAPALKALLGCAVSLEAELALVFDDWQFADDASVDLIAEALSAPVPSGLRWGHASRTLAGARADARIAALQRRSALRSVTLAPLALGAVSELVGTLKLQGADAGRLAQALVGRVGGNPLHILETLRHMLEERLPLRPEQVAAPGQVKQLVSARLQQLPDAPRQVLRLAAVAGADFSVELAESVSGRGALELWDDWSLLEHMGLFNAQGIAHDLYAEAVLDTLPRPIGRVLHARVAAWLQARAHEPARLAAHWLAAGDEAGALPHLLAAGRKAWHAARAAEAYGFMRRASEIELAAGHLQAAFDHAFECADVVSEIGTPQQMEQCIAFIEPLARTEQQRFRVRFLHEVLRFMQGQLEAALQAAMALLSEAIALGDTRIECECRFAIANRAAADGRFDEAVQHMAAGERLLRQDGDMRRANALAGSIAMVFGMRGQVRMAIREQQRMLPLLEAQGDLATWTVVVASRAVQHAWQGDADSALADAERALQSVGSASIAPPDTLVAQRYTLDALRWSGHWHRALQAQEVFGQRLAQQGEFPRAGEPVAALYLQLGRADLAGPLLQALKAEPPQRARERLRLELLALQVACHPGLPAGWAWPAEATTGEDLALAMEWALWSGLQAEPPWPVSALQTLWARARQADVMLLARPLRFLLARRLLDAGEAEAARPLLPDAAPHDTLHRMLAATPWAALYGAQALARHGQAQAAAALAVAGAEWLQQAARSGLPEPFRDSFLHRHPVHRELLALAARGANSA